MILIELKNYLKQMRVMNVFDLSRQLNVAPEVVKDMVGHWVRKGCVRAVPKLPGCGSKCVKCNPWAMESYEWVGQK